MHLLKFSDILSLALLRSDSPFVRQAAKLVQTSLHLINDANKELQHMLDYPFTQTLASDEVSEVLEDDFPSVRKLALTYHWPRLFR